MFHASFQPGAPGRPRGARNRRHSTLTRDDDGVPRYLPRPLDGDGHNLANLLDQSPGVGVPAAVLIEYTTICDIGAVPAGSGQIEANRPNHDSIEAVTDSKKT